MKKKLSKAQVYVLWPMANGWQLGHDTHTNRYRVQKGGCGYGGDSLPVHWRTCHTLLAAGMIEADTAYRYPTRTYHITGAGLNALNGA